MFYIDAKKLPKEGSSKQESSETVQERKPDKEMQDWVGSIVVQNHLLPSHMTFDNKRHLSMRSKYADAIQTISLSNVIHEAQEEHHPNNISTTKGLNKKRKIKKYLSYETYNLGLGPVPKLSTRISKDAVKTNRQKDNTLKFHGRKLPPPPGTKPLMSVTGLSEPVSTKSTVLKG